MHPLDQMALQVAPGKAILVDGDGMVINVISDPQPPIEVWRQRLAGWVRAARTSKGWTQERMGSYLGVQAIQISRWETNARVCPTHQVKDIAKLTGTRVPRRAWSNTSPERTTQ